MQGFRLAAISDVEKTKLRHKNFQSQWTVKYRSGAPVEGYVKDNYYARFQTRNYL